MDEVYCSYEREFSQRLNRLNMAIGGGLSRHGGKQAKRSRGQESTKPKWLSYRKEKLEEVKQKPRPREEEV